MASFTKRLLSTRRASALATGSLLAAIGAGALPVAASANSSQVAIIQDGTATSDPAAGFGEMRALGATTVRIFLPWSAIAPGYSSAKKPRFNATDPGAYPASHWSVYDNAVRQAVADHMTIDLTVTGGAPVWAEGAGIPRADRTNIAFAWKPSAAEYGQFFTAVGKRYSGSYTPRGASSPLPRVHFWAIYNEPNFGQDLGPQAVNGSRTAYAPMSFRNLLNAGWKALQSTGHGHDTILWGEFAAHGSTFRGPSHQFPQGIPGNYGQTKPGQFVRYLFCVDSRYRKLLGNAATAVGCPTTKSAARGFRRANPALFSASGVSVHPYATTASPITDGRSDPDFATFPNLGTFGAGLDHAASAYGAHPHFALYSTEYGYITNPPHVRGGYPSEAQAAAWINLAEYLSYKNPRVKSYMQYLLKDPPPAARPYDGFASGLETYTGVHKATYDAYRMPVYMPRTSFSRRQSVEVWGAARPAPFANIDGFTAAKVLIQLKRGGTWTTVASTTTGNGGYFDVHVTFPASGSVRLQWSYPNASLLPAADQGRTIHSRTFSVNVH
ncbi:MAG: hypothetical protein M3022_14165 [Actinomycetota bacterium]|nr:hypothetical protein [Actinomycetota bacterium]